MVARSIKSAIPVSLLVVCSATPASAQFAVKYPDTFPTTQSLEQFIYKLGGCLHGCGTDTNSCRCDEDQDQCDPPEPPSEHCDDCCWRRFGPDAASDEATAIEDALHQILVFQDTLGHHSSDIEDIFAHLMLMFEEDRSDHGDVYFLLVAHTLAMRSDDSDRKTAFVRQALSQLVHDKKAMMSVSSVRRATLLALMNYLAQGETVESEDDIRHLNAAYDCAREFDLIARHVFAVTTRSTSARD